MSAAAHVQEPPFRAPLTLAEAVALIADLESAEVARQGEIVDRLLDAKGAEELAAARDQRPAGAVFRLISATLTERAQRRHNEEMRAYTMAASAGMAAQAADKKRARAAAWEDRTLTERMLVVFEARHHGERQGDVAAEQLALFAKARAGELEPPRDWEP